MERRTLVSSNGKRVAIEGDRRLRAIADGGGAGYAGDIRWQNYDVERLGNGQVALRAWDGKYVCAEGGGGRELVANRDVIGSWETFGLIDLGGGGFALQAKNGKYVCAEGGGGRELVANRDQIGPWETFRMEDLHTFPADIAVALINLGGGAISVTFNMGYLGNLRFEAPIVGLGVGTGGGFSDLRFEPDVLVAKPQVAVNFAGVVFAAAINFDNGATGVSTAWGPFAPGGGQGVGQFRRI